MNPYASFLGSRNAIETVAQTRERVAALIAAMGEERAKRTPAPGKWSAREIVAHLADCELAFGFRLRQTLAEDNPTLQPFDQEKWAASYSAYDLASALETFSALRRWNLALIRSLKPEDFKRKATHPERGEMTFQTIIETMGGHDLNHLAQIERLAAPAAAAN